MLILLNACSSDESVMNTFTNNSPEKTLEIINDWNSKWLELDRYAQGMRPNGTARALVYIPW